MSYRHARIATEFIQKTAEPKNSRVVTMLNRFQQADENTFVSVFSFSSFSLDCASVCKTCAAVSCTPTVTCRKPHVFACCLQCLSKAQSIHGVAEHCMSACVGMQFTRGHAIYAHHRVGTLQMAGNALQRAKLSYLLQWHSRRRLICISCSTCFPFIIHIC